MTTRVVNLRKGPYDVYIGRTGKGQDGTFGNPYRVGETCGRCGQLHSTRGETIPCFRAYFQERVSTDETFRARVLELRGKRLGCFCRPKACHGDVIAEWLDTARSWADVPVYCRTCGGATEDLPDEYGSLGEGGSYERFRCLRKGVCRDVSIIYVPLPD